MSLKAGDPFLAYSGTSHEGETVRLPDFGGDGNLVVFFYPRATTRGCVRETTEFSARGAELAALGAKVVGVSVDDAPLQNEHAIQCAANFPLLCDTDKSLTETLGILNERGMSARTTYVLDKTGTVRRVFEGVSVDGHVDEVLQTLAELKA